MRPSLFIERLSGWVWVTAVLPRLMRARFQGGRGPRACVYLEATRAGLAVARVTRALTACPVIQLDFQLYRIHDEQGCVLPIRVIYHDMLEAQAEVMREPIIERALAHAGGDTALSAYVRKALVVADASGLSAWYRLLAAVRICAWALKRQGGGDRSGVLVVSRRPWIGALARYAKRCGIELEPTAGLPSVRVWLAGCLHPWLVDMVRAARLWCSTAGLWHLVALWRRRCRPGPLPRGRCGDGEAGPRLAVECWGQFNLRRPSWNSDLAFFGQSALPMRDTLVIFGTPRDPLDARKAEELAAHGMMATALDPRGAADGLPVFSHRPRRCEHRVIRRPSLWSVSGAEGRWLRYQLGRYAASRGWWAALCRRYGIKVHVSWYRYDPSHDALADAVRALGGVSAVYQRSYLECPSAEAAVTADVVFGFARGAAAIEARSGSVIPYHVTTGYLGDFRFALLRSQAHDVRGRLRARGVEHILAYFDENSSEDARWGSGHGFMRDHYAFLLEKVLTVSWLGLVLKPKVPSTLRRRLGPVAVMLERALGTGRCVLYEDGALHGAYPPAAAALAADIAVHGHLFAATAGVEAALAGVPTLLLDQEGWPESALYRLGVGRVVFRDWDRLWAACEEHWRRPGGVPGLGDWTPMLDELDPFRDGRAAQRMGTYLHWLLEGFRAGASRETVLMDAAQRYADLWGADKITSVNVNGSGRREVVAGSPPCARATTEQLVEH